MCLRRWDTLYRLIPVSTQCLSLNFQTCTSIVHSLFIIQTTFNIKSIRDRYTIPYESFCEQVGGRGQALPY